MVAISQSHLCERYRVSLLNNNNIRPDTTTRMLWAVASFYRWASAQSVTDFNPPKMWGGSYARIAADSFNNEKKNGAGLEGPELRDYRLEYAETRDKAIELLIRAGLNLNR